MPEDTKNSANATVIPEHLALLNAFPDGVLVAGPDNRVAFANRPMAGILGCNVEELIGETVSNVCGKELAATFLKTDETKSAPPALECVVEAASGHRIPIEIRPFVVDDKDSNAHFQGAVIRDARDLKERLNNRIKTNRLAAIGELAACVAHDISNPLSVVKLYSEWLSNELENTDTPSPDIMETLRDGMSNIQKSADRIEQLITNLRNFSRESDSEPTVIDVKRVLEEAIFLVDKRFRQAGIVIEQHVPDGPFPICAHGTQLEQAFLNILENSLEALEKTTDPKIEIVISKESANIPNSEDVYVCQISDNGCGMPPEVRDMAFKSFYAARTNRNASGLGLAIVRNIVRRHGGEVHLDSEPDQGTSVSITLSASLQKAGDDHCSS